MISVVTITFNNHEELILTLNSLQGLKIESVVINGGSCLETLSFLKNYEGIGISEPDEGISDAFNKGILNSHGSAVVFVNSGDILVDKNYYDKALSIFSERPEIDFIYADITLLDVNAGPLRVRSQNPLPNMPFMHPTLIVRKKVYEQVGTFKLKFKTAMDFDFIYRLVNAGFVGHYIPSVVIEMNGKGVSSQPTWAILSEKIQVIRENQDYSLRTWLIVLSLICKFIVKKPLGSKFLGYYRRFKYK